MRGERLARIGESEPVGDLVELAECLDDLQQHRVLALQVVLETVEALFEARQLKLGHRVWLRANK